jgi:hypothetical protein
MHKHSLLAFIFLFSCLNFDLIKAFCGKCDECNVWGCNCDSDYCTEFKSVIGALESILSQTNPHEIFKTIDSNQDGFIVLAEAEKYLIQKATLDRNVTKLDIPTDFDKIDTNKDGKIESSEFDHVDN